MNSNPKVHVVDVNSGVHSSVTQQAGISLSRYWSGEASGTEKKAHVFRFFFVNIPPSETVSWMSFSTTHNIQRSVFRLTFRSQCQLSCRSYILQLIIVNPTNINYVWQILQLIIVHCASISPTWRSMKLVINRGLLTVDNKRIEKQIWLDPPPLRETELFKGLVVK